MYSSFAYVCSFLLICSYNLAAASYDHIISSWTEKNVNIAPIKDAIIGFDSVANKIWWLGGTINNTNSHYYASMDASAPESIYSDVDYGTFTSHSLNNHIPVNSQSFTTINREIYFIDAPNIRIFNMETASLDPMIINASFVSNTACLTNINNEYLLIIGGINNFHNEYLRSMYIYDLHKQKWHNEATPSMIYSRASFSCSVIDDELYVFGGKTGTRSVTNTVEQLYVGDIESIHDYQWFVLEASLSSNKSNTRSIAVHDINEYVLIIGGVHENGVIVNDIERMEVNTKYIFTDKQLPQTIYTSTSRAVVIANEHIYVFALNVCYISNTISRSIRTTFVNTGEYLESYLYSEIKWMNLPLFFFAFGAFVLLFSIIFLYSLCILIPFMSNRKAFKQKEIVIVSCINIIACFNVLVCTHLTSITLHAERISQPNVVIFLQLLVKYFYFIIFYCLCILYTLSTESISLTSFRTKHRMITITTGGILVLHCMLLMWNMDDVHANKYFKMSKLQIMYIIDASWTLMLLIMVSFSACYVCTIKHVTSQTSSIVMQKESESASTTAAEYIYNELKSLWCIASFILVLNVLFFIIDFLTSVYCIIYVETHPFLCISADLLSQFILCLVICVLFGHQIQLFLRKRLHMDPFLCMMSCNCCKCLYDDNKYDDKYWDEMKRKRKSKVPSSSEISVHTKKLEIQQADESMDESTNLNFQHHILNSVTINDIMLEDVVCDMANMNATTLYHNTKHEYGENVQEKEGSNDTHVAKKCTGAEMISMQVNAQNSRAPNYRFEAGVNKLNKCNIFPVSISIPIFDIANDRDMTLASPKINI